MIWLEIVSTLIACGFIIVVGVKCWLVVGGVVHTQVPVLNLRHNCRVNCRGLKVIISQSFSFRRCVHFSVMLLHCCNIYFLVFSLTRTLWLVYGCMEILNVVLVLVTICSRV